MQATGISGVIIPPGPGAGSGFVSGPALPKPRDLYPEMAEAIPIDTAYFERNAGRMCYPEFQHQVRIPGEGEQHSGVKPNSVPG